MSVTRLLSRATSREHRAQQLALLGVEPRGLAHQLDAARDGPEGVADLVREPRREAPELREALGVGDRDRSDSSLRAVVDHHHAAAHDVPSWS
jgi:hypothetical protein